eukprot:5743698-Amphidinium_carterae.1
MQYGCGPAVGCDFVTFVHEQLSSEMVRRKRPHAVLFLDVRGAFDSMIRQLLWSTSAVEAQHVVERLGLSPENAATVTHAIQTTPGLLSHDQVPPELVAVIQAMYTGDWVRLGPTSGNCDVQPLKGARQGGSLSGLLWCRYQARINLLMKEAIVSLGLSITIRAPASRTLRPDPRDSTLTVPPTVYMDDASLLVSSACDMDL